MQLDRNGIGKEFLGDVAELSMLQHENLVNIIGYCSDGDQRLLVYELFAGRTLENRLFGNYPFHSLNGIFHRIFCACSCALFYVGFVS